MGMSIDREDLLVEIATRYYLHDQSQQEIADQLDLSRPNISRLLKEARERGIVNITIQHPLGRKPQLEQALIKQFGLREAGVVRSIPGDLLATLYDTARLAGRMLEQFLPTARVLGISWGTTINAIAQTFQPQQHYDVEVVQMMGGVGGPDPAIDGPALAQRLAHALADRYRYLHAPLIVDTATTASALCKQHSIAETLNIAARSDVALVGIGAVERDVSSLMRAGYLKPDEFDVLQRAGVVGDICARHFDIQGRPLVPEIDQRLIAITLEQIALIPVVIGVACGEIKAKAILGALRGGYLNVLITDAVTAEAILALAAESDKTLNRVD
jgi:DNA-binding transcriptional regulator LsrR (DeoR family)